MTGLKFTKISASGNDFILIDNREKAVKDASALARRMCPRSVSVGADGLILIEKSKDADFKMRIINADGSEAEMCGNGARAAARFAFENKIVPLKMEFETLAGRIDAEVYDDKTVKINLNYSVQVELDKIIDLDGETLKVHFINTGVPHVIIFKDDIENTDVNFLGRKIRYHKNFQPAGANVNFVRDLNHNTIRVRTYERGVEAETLACGTGSVASAVICAIKKEISPPVNVITTSGDKLKVDFKLSSEGVDDLFLTGPAKIIYTAESRD